MENINIEKHNYILETKYTKVFISKNDFLNTGIVKYEDLNGNKIMIICNRNGKGFSLKCRPQTKDLKVNVLDFEFPFNNISGANFDIKTDTLDKDTLAETIDQNMYFFEEAIQIAERWIQICFNLVSYFSDTSLLSNLVYRQSAKSNPEQIMQPQDIEENYLANIVDDLDKYAEMKDFVSLINVTDDQKTDISKYLPKEKLNVLNH